MNLIICYNGFKENYMKNAEEKNFDQMMWITIAMVLLYAFMK